MDFSYPVEVEAFRAELRAWLEAHLPDDLRGTSTALEMTPDRLERLRWWNREMADARYAAISWPPEYGGRGAGVLEQVVFAQEMHRAGAPGTVNVIGLSNIAPAIMEHGTEEQKTALLPRMLRGDDIWCQGFSEPDAGSDLASLSTSAVVDGDHWVVSGQKTWNTLGAHATWCELLVRTDPDAPKHRGITCLLVDMTLPGIDVRPLETLTRDREFSEIFFDDVRVPLSSTLGPVNDGWRVALTTLAHERAGVATLHLGLRGSVARLIAEARATPLGDGRTATDDPVIRRRLARVYVEAELLMLVADRALSGQLHGRPTGPEGSIAKLLWSEASQHVADLRSEILGPAGLARDVGRSRASSRSLTIAGGTTQVNKNIVATRILGLPRSVTPPKQ
jgi:alkylation response protein AidB-like acyl-CoA dehydrogenase